MSRVLACNKSPGCAIYIHCRPLSLMHDLISLIQEEALSRIKQQKERAEKMAPGSIERAMAEKAALADLDSLLASDEYVTVYMLLCVCVLIDWVCSFWRL